MTETPDIIEAMARAIEIEMDRDFEAWRARWISVTGIADDAPNPPAGQYATSPEKIARAAFTVALDHLREPSIEVLFAGWPTKGGSREDMLEIWQAMLSQLRKEALP